jgi:peptide/nickel transport system ATP-binding protein
MICRIKNLCVSKSISNGLKTEQINILNNLNLEVRKKSVHVIIGESGSGKSTLLRTIAGIEKSYTGVIVFDDSVNTNKHSIQILFQNNGELINPLRKVESLLADSFINSSSLNRSEEIGMMLMKFNFPREILTKRAFELSGGEQQRVALIRLLLARPKLLLLDEPFSSQDTQANMLIIANLLEMKMTDDITIICVTHDINLIKNFATEISVLHKGEITETNSPAELISSPKHEFTRFLLDSIKLKLTEERIDGLRK